jgi:ribonucleoside-triphosphate reductase
MYITKRSGEKELFNRQKITEAIRKAFDSIDYTVDDSVIEELANSIHVWEDITIDEIQEMVIETLRDFDFGEVADSYLIYKTQKDEARKFVQKQIDYMLGYINSSENAATSSATDANANVTLKNVANLESETPKENNRLIQRAWMKRALKELYPELAKQYEKDINNHIIYPHDEASTPTIKNYCEAVSLYPLATDGTSTMDGTGTKPPSHLSSFAGQLNNLLFLLSSQCKGAVAFGEFFNFFDHYAAMEYGEDYHKRANEYADTEIVKKRKTIGDKIDQTFQQIVFYWNQPAGNRGSQSPFSNISYYDSNYWHALFDDFRFPDGTAPSWERVDWLQKRFMKWFNKEREKTLLTFPVETMALLHDGKDIIDKDYKNFTAEMYAEGHSFFTYLSDNPDSLASCCRLKNKIQENTFSFTNGLTGVQTGSCNVITLNLNRIVQDWFREYNKKVPYCSIYDEGLQDDLKAYLSKIVERVQKYHIAYKHNLYMFEKAGQLTSSTAGYISMKKLYSTIGLNGINEAAMFLGIDVSYNQTYKDFCRLITGTISELNKKNSTPDYQFNQEFVPAETLGSKNFNWDKKDGYWVPDDGRVLYNSYFYDAHDDTSVLDKMRMHGKEFTELLDGGVGCHINLNEHLSKEQYSKLIDFAIANGTSYFTFNIPNTQCDDCGFISKQRLKECPKCGSKNLTWWTRIIGYLRPTKAFDQFRRKEESQRTYSENV